MEKTLGVYIHIPFCASKCGYCDFYSRAGCEKLMPKYQDALVQHIRESLPSLQPYYVDTVYFGGGTPTVYGAKRLCELFNELKKSGRVMKDAEVTLEANPDSVRLSELKMLRREGFNRISIGAQCSDSDVLKILGRRHNWLQVEGAVSAARLAGFDNVSLDLMYGLPSQNKSSWAETLAKALALRPEHISCYGLTLEKNTPMYRYKGSPFLPDDDEQADMYLFAVDYLEHFGYHQYEVSNFAISGYECKHNMKYWRLGDYLGFGASAHSGVDGTRYSLVPDIKGYIAGVLGEERLMQEFEQIDSLERASEYIMLGMRTSEGISSAEYHRLYKSEFEPIAELLEQFVAKGWAEHGAEELSWHFTSSGFLLSNLLIGALLEAQAGNRVAVNPWMREAFEAGGRTELPPGEEEQFKDSLRQRINKTR